MSKVLQRRKHVQLDETSSMFSPSIFFLCLWRLKNVKFCVFVDLRYLNEYFDLTLSFFNVFGKESETWWTTDKLPRLIFKTYEHQ